MKKWIVAVVVVVIVALGVVVLATGKSKTDKTGVDFTAQQTKIAVLMNGEPDDMGWSQAQYVAFEGLRDKLNLDISYSFSLVVSDGDSVRAELDKAIENGAKIIFTTSYDFMEYVKEYSQKYPDVYFCSCAGNYTGDNTATYFGRIYQMRYLSGIVAGATTETGHIGYVAAVPIPEVIRGINAFTLGVQSVNPEAVVHVEWTEDWVSDDRAYECAQKLLDSFPIDIMTQHHDSLKPIEAAQERGVYSIGYNTDQSSVSAYYLTAPVWNWKPIIEKLVYNVLSDTFEGKNYWEGIETETVSLADFSELVSDEARTAVDAAWTRLLEGDWDVFYGPIYDQDGNIRIAEGERMSDRQLLEDFTWFVKGVDGIAPEN